MNVIGNSSPLFVASPLSGFRLFKRCIWLSLVIDLQDSRSSSLQRGILVDVDLLVLATRHSPILPKATCSLFASKAHFSIEILLGNVGEMTMTLALSMTLHQQPWYSSNCDWESIEPNEMIVNSLRPIKLMKATWFVVIPTPTRDVS